MSGNCFLDTNIVVYAFDVAADRKRRRARDLMSGGDWVVSWQVIQEFSSLALHKFATPMRPIDLEEYLALVLWPRCVVFPSPAIGNSALRIHAQTQYRFYDCLIAAAALASGARILYSEDLQDGRKIETLTVRNPFI